MTYWAVLGAFVAPPVVALMALVASKARRASQRPYLAILALAGVALVYTTPWDNYLVATGVWWYDEALVAGFTIGWVPIEEYAFFVLQTLLTGLWTALLLYIAGAPARAADRPNATLRLRAATAAGALWAAAAGLWLSGWPPGTYLALILAWALIPLAIQLAYGADILWANRRLLWAAIGAPTAYLWLVDLLAIRSGTWTLDPAQTLGIALGGALAVEEMAFFLVTNVLISFGTALMLVSASRQRASTLLAHIRGDLAPGAP